MLCPIAIAGELEALGPLYSFLEKNGLIATTVIFIAAFFGLLRVHLTTTREHSAKYEALITELRDDYADMRVVAKEMLAAIQSKRRSRRKSTETSGVRKVGALSDD